MSAAESWGEKERPRQAGPAQSTNAREELSSRLVGGELRRAVSAAESWGENQQPKGRLLLQALSHTLAWARISRIFSSNLGERWFHRKFYAIWVRFRLSNDQRQLREISHFSISSWPTSSSRPRKRPSPSRGSPSPSRPPPRRRRRRLLSPSPPQSLLPPTAVPPACRRLCVHR